ncbi:hypothetical protein E4T56_gene8159 [Termitomyces sp. T112]|nr:hypothetical protein E4T56_gene8159 [Termitomyces sp. T112]
MVAEVIQRTPEFSRVLWSSGKSPGDVEQAAKVLEPVMEVGNRSPLTLSAILSTLDHGAAHDSADVQALLTFANAITQIEKNHQEAQCKCKAKEKHCAKDQDIEMLGPSATCFGKHKANAEPNGEPKPKKIKVILAYSSSLSPFLCFSALICFPANLKPGSKAVLLHLGQINAALKAVQLADDGTLLPCANLQKHCDAVQLAAQQQLYSLDIALQTYKLIWTCLDHLDKTLRLSDIEHTGDLLNNLQVLPEVLSPF